MIFRFEEGFPEDGVEASWRDAQAARARLGQRQPAVLALLEQRHALWLSTAPSLAPDRLQAFDDALVLAYVRAACRHGSWGEDHHEYHSEVHCLELLDRRLGALLADHGVEALPVEDWLALSLFCTCHDLRQRERTEFRRGVGANEAASIEETLRILNLCGLDASRERSLHVALELMIAGSTFDARPQSGDTLNTAEAVSTGGPLAPRLEAKIRKHRPALLGDPLIQRGLRLARIASDLDTANVAEPFPLLVDSALRLCREREMRCGRSLDAPGSGGEVLTFLTSGQLRYFNELHRFVSPLGEMTLAAGKRANAPRLSAVCARMRERFGPVADTLTARQVIGGFVEESTRSH